MSASYRKHWIHERVTAILLVPISLWFVWSVVSLRDADYATVIEWLGAPLNAGLLLVSLLITLYHAALGVQVIIEDYVHDKCLNRASLILNNVAFALVALACVVSLATIVL